MSVVLALPYIGAQNIETIYCKDGSEYSGYISRQMPGNNVTVNAVIARIVIPEINVRGSRYVSVPVSCLTGTAKGYLKKNNLINSDSIAVYTVITDKTTYDEVLVVKRGDKTVTLLSFANTSYVLPWSSLKRTRKTPCDFQVTEEVRLKSGSVIEGVITDQVIGSSLTLKTFKGSYNVEMSDIASISSRIDAKDKKYLWKRLPLFDCLTMSDGTEYEGYVVSRLLGSSITILLRSNNQEKILPLSNIKVFAKVINPAVVCSGKAIDSGLLLNKKVNFDNGNEIADSSLLTKSEKEQDGGVIVSTIAETSVSPSESVTDPDNNASGSEKVQPVEESTCDKPADDTKSDVKTDDIILSVKGKEFGLSTLVRDSDICYVVGGGSVTVERGDYVTVEVANLNVGTANVFATKFRRVKDEASAYYGTKITSFSQTGDNPYTNCDILQHGKSLSKIGFSVTKRGTFVLVLNEVYVALVEVE